MKFLITTENGIQEFTHFKYTNGRITKYVLNFYKEGYASSVLSLDFELKINLENAIKSLCYTIATAAPGALLIDSTKVLKVKSEKEYLGYGIDP